MLLELNLRASPSPAAMRMAAQAMAVVGDLQCWSVLIVPGHRWGGEDTLFHMIAVSCDLLRWILICRGPRHRLNSSWIWEKRGSKFHPQPAKCQGLKQSGSHCLWSRYLLFCVDFVNQNAKFFVFFRVVFPAWLNQNHIPNISSKLHVSTCLRLFKDSFNMFLGGYELQTCSFSLMMLFLEVIDGTKLQKNLGLFQWSLWWATGVFHWMAPWQSPQDFEVWMARAKCVETKIKKYMFCGLCGLCGLVEKDKTLKLRKLPLFFSVFPSHCTTLPGIPSHMPSSWQPPVLRVTRSWSGVGPQIHQKSKEKHLEFGHMLIVCHLYSFVIFTCLQKWRLFGGPKRMCIASFNKVHCPRCRSGASHPRGQCSLGCFYATLLSGGAGG